ncbi:class I SAM-dependent methyltransferase [Parasphaerochaeta coccoides]|uniref:Tetracenomycin polyketide synthesis O-methyltransferase TcmP n=1 Tax=Parasphaerochaeta coccoides (strain ATCC BAA-1237 / DSM 17374 / SPN1) TaxID=760011 RepID=F4GH51_PARC1|nr:class I SAM-dependent methyltransferase [Parasphaerochaeta coccoides]AEC01526.1 tetracenomycin polyketide synthesis O-methyltransferase TcmP [Parasphaerochaeta coccoides DSM 17374]
MGNFKGVADTLFIPLEARIYVSKKYPEYFYDEKALSLEKYIADDIIQKKSSEYSFMASVARYHNMDDMVRTYIAQNGTCNVIYLGAGLETAYFRLNNKQAFFYEIDLPEVIHSRRIVLGDNENESLIGGNAFDVVWAAHIDKALPTLLLASGVFQYFKQEKIIKLIHNVRDTFDNAEFIFDATNQIGIKYANAYVRKTGNTDAQMYFYINDSTEFARQTGTVLLEERPFFTQARIMLAKRLKLYTRIAMKVADDKKRTIIVHLKL